MALFKSLRGKRENLPPTKTDGYAYFCIDDGTFWIDYTDESGIVQRKQINAKDAETLTGCSVADIVDETTVTIPNSKAVFDALALKSDKAYAMELHQEGELLETLPYGYWMSIAYGAGKYVIVSDEPGIYYSTDLKTWTQAEIPVSYIECQKILYGNGTFVVIPYSGDKTLYSTDGVNWTTADFTYDAAWNGAIFADGKFVAVGCNDYAVVAYSTDGITWSYSDLPQSNKWKSISYGNGKFVLAGDDSSSNFTLYSTDLITWNEVSLPVTEGCSDITFGNGLFVMIGNNYSIYSSDGITWEYTALPVVSNWVSVTYGNGIFSAVSSRNEEYMYSTDGINWEISYFPIEINWAEVRYINNLFIAVACMSSYIAYSTDGMNWVTYLSNNGIDATSKIGQIVTPYIKTDDEPTRYSFNLMSSGGIYDAFMDRISYFMVQASINSSTNELKAYYYPSDVVDTTLAQINSTHKLIGGLLRVGSEYSTLNFDSAEKNSEGVSFAKFIGYYHGDKYVFLSTYDATTNTHSTTFTKEIDTTIPRSTAISLVAADWTGDASPYSQVVTISSVTENSKIDLQPTAAQIVDLQNQEIQLMVENDAGTCTCYAIGGKPTSDLDMQVLITEVVPV